MRIMRLPAHEQARAKLVDLTHHDDLTLDAAAAVLMTSPHESDRDMARKWQLLRIIERGMADKS